jgi:hypothetical protein
MEAPSTLTGQTKVCPEFFNNTGSQKPSKKKKDPTLFFKAKGLFDSLFLFSLDTAADRWAGFARLHN